MDKLICEIVSNDSIEYYKEIKSIITDMDLKNVEVEKKRVKNISKLENISSSIVGKNIYNRTS